MANEIIKKEGFDVHVIRSNRRKTTCIQINHGLVSIRVPNTLPTTKIDFLVDCRTPWIKQKLHLQQQLPVIKQRHYISGEELRYLGKCYRLKVEIVSKETVKLINGYLLVLVSSNNADVIRNALKKWYVDHAHQQLESRLRHYSSMMQVFPSSIQIREYKARWGSCNIKGQIKFNWRLIMAPSDVVDYVVVHELCHLIEHNHSANFWRLVQSVMPGYKTQRQWLRENGHHLEI